MDEIYISSDQIGICAKCGTEQDLRMNFCFDCATSGEKRAAQRTVVQHVTRGFRNIWRRNGNARFDFQWAWERLTRTGDYAPGGPFEREYGIKA